MGIERVAMLKYGIPDLRTFYDSDLRWLRHYGFLPLDIPSLVRGPLTGGCGRAAPAPSPLASLSPQRGGGRGEGHSRWNSPMKTPRLAATHLDSDAPLAEIVERLVMLGHDVESVRKPGAALEPFIVASVVSAERHPNADRLKVCVVDTGKEQVQVVCGAPNARAGMKGVFAPAGTVIPRTGAVLKESTIRGVASRGMLCSADELGLGDDHDGIIEVAPDAPVGAKYADLLGLGDAVIDIKVTPNRADCLGVRGIARDLAASGLGRLKPLDTTPVPGRFRSPIGIEIEDLRPARCFSAAICAGCTTVRARNGCGVGWRRSGCGRSRPWSTSPIF